MRRGAAAFKSRPRRGETCLIVAMLNPMPLRAHPLLFEFEILSSENLDYIPMCIRFNLDRCGIRITLAQWQALPHAERVELTRYPVADSDAAAERFARALTVQLAATDAGVPAVAAPITGASAAGSPALEALATGSPATGSPAAEAPAAEAPAAPPESPDLAWSCTTQVPAALLRQYALHHLPPISEPVWAQLSEFQRYVLNKLSRRATANHDFLPALREFGLAAAD
jgi:hypothetical protein